MPRTIVPPLSRIAVHYPAGQWTTAPSSSAWQSANGFVLIGTTSRRENLGRTVPSKASTASYAPLKHANMHCRAMDECRGEAPFATMRDARQTLKDRIYSVATPAIFSQLLLSAVQFRASGRVLLRNRDGRSASPDRHRLRARQS